MTIEAPPIEDGTPDDSRESKETNADLHAYNKRLKNENKSLRKMEMDRQVVAIGLDPAEGLGKAVVNTFDGDVTEEGAVAGFAQSEYNHEAATAPVPQAVAMGERVEQLQSISQPVEIPVQPPPGQDVKDKLDANDPTATRQDSIGSINTKAGEFMEKFYGENQ